MNQPGYTDFGFMQYEGAERIEFFKSKGAKYLFVSDRTLYDNESYKYLEPYLVNKIGSHKNVDIFDIRTE
jgi:hypothetical protein